MYIAISIYLDVYIAIIAYIYIYDYSYIFIYLGWSSALDAGIAWPGAASAQQMPYYKITVCHSIVLYSILSYM